MVEFLTGDALTDRIRKVVHGDNVKCAVAYWGNHNFGDAWARRSDVQIVCDIVSGSTSAKALELIGAPSNKNLRHIHNLHSKVYLSDNGVVVASANASAGGLGYDGKPARLEEAGTFHDDDNFHSIVRDWFSEIFDRSHPVDRDAVEMARWAYRPPISHAQFKKKIDESIDFLDQLALDPDLFSRKGISFVICSTPLGEAEYNKAIDKSDNVGIDAEDIQGFRAWRKSGRFANWSDVDMEYLTDRFIEIYIGVRGGNLLASHLVAHRLKGRKKDSNVFLTSVFDKKSQLQDINLRLTEERWAWLRTLVTGSYGYRFGFEDGAVAKILRPEEFAIILRDAQKG